jgi:asparagine synthase (glutamine-hydrolysing)
MSFGYLPGEGTLLQGIKRLLPGYYLLFDGQLSTIKKYWHLSFPIDSGGHHEGWYIERLRTLLEDSIRLRLSALTHKYGDVFFVLSSKSLSL